MDHSVPPSYHEATNREWLPLIAPYISSISLCSAVLVSNKWHQNLIRWLWGNPASHFGTEGDRVYVALTRFKRTLSIARIQVRQLTHTLHLPPAQTELYDRPQYQWLRDVLERLPNLQCLVVSQIPFFDHSALVALRASSQSSNDVVTSKSPVFPLRLLIASQCNNIIPASLGPAFRHFPHLTYLDLSHTPAVREDSVLASLGLLPQLQILKLRRTGLKDAHIAYLADVLNPKSPSHSTTPSAYRLRSLDVRDNYLTDQAVETIVKRFIHGDRDIHNLRHLNHLRQILQHGAIQDPYAGQVDEKDPLRQPDLDEYFIRTLTQPEEGRTYLEDLCHYGLTHLYLADNLITAEALLGLIRTRNLHVLDAGSIDSINSPARPRTQSDSARSVTGNDATLATDAQILTHSLEDNGCKSFTYLRISHAIVTASAGQAKQKQVELDTPDCQISDVHEVHGEPLAKRPARPQFQPIFELEDNAPAYELPGDMWYAELPDNSVEDKKQEAMITEHDEFASLPVYQLYETSSLPEAVSEVRSLVSATGSILISPEISMSAAITPVDARFEISRLIGKRQELRNGVRDERRGLLPGRVPAMQILILTKVPNLTRSTRLIQNVKDFIADCAMEHHLATKQAYLEECLRNTIASTRNEAIRARARGIFALQTIVLELDLQRSGEPSEAEVLPTPPASPTTRLSFSKPKTLSSVDDHDTETLWKAAKNDFSFFDEEECGVPASDANSRIPMSSLLEKFSLNEDISDSEGDMLSPQDPRIAQKQPLRDVIAEVARWRADRRKQHQNAPHGTYTPGFWPGEVKIVRPNLRSLQGNYDYYGNHFGKGVYR